MQAPHLCSYALSHVYQPAFRCLSAMVVRVTSSRHRTSYVSFLGPASWKRYRGSRNAAIVSISYRNPEHEGFLPRSLLDYKFDSAVSLSIRQRLYKATLSGGKTETQDRPNIVAREIKWQGFDSTNYPRLLIKTCFTRFHIVFFHGHHCSSVLIHVTHHLRQLK